MSQQQPIVLYVEDSPTDAELLAELLALHGERSFTVEVCPTLGAALERLPGGGVDLILLDLQLPDSSGLATFEAMQAAAPSTPIVVMTGLGDDSLAIEAVRRGAQDFLSKDAYAPATLGRILRLSIERKRLEDDLRDLAANLEERVQERTEELQTVNKALEEFAFQVSHDLRTPLRHIRNLTQMLEEDYAELLPDDGQKLVDQIQRATLRADQLVKALLRLASLRTAALDLGRVPVRKLVADLVATLQRPNATREVRIRIGAGVIVQADPSLIRLVFANLLENAWKFTRRSPTALIEVKHTRAASGEHLFSVHDQGVGFDPKYASKLFEPMHRLHAARDFEGIGMGLAAVARIVERHGGRAWGEGIPDAGATFSFTLPPKHNLITCTVEGAATL